MSTAFADYVLGHSRTRTMFANGVAFVSCYRSEYPESKRRYTPVSLGKPPKAKPSVLYRIRVKRKTKP
jgi:hypothetical protein